MEIHYDGNSPITGQAHFYEPWLDSCASETLLPEYPWHQVSDKIGKTLATQVKPFLQDLNKRQIIFKLLGRDFVLKYFSEYSYVPSLLSPPNISDAASAKMEKHAKAWLWDQCTKAAEHTGCLFTDDNSTELSKEMTQFVNHTYSLVEKAMDMFLAKHEDKKKEESLETNDASWNWKGVYCKRRKSVESKDLHFTLNRQAAFQVKENNASNDLEVLSPPLNSSVSDALGGAVCSIIGRDSESVALACNRLTGKLLPKTLRRFIWMHKLLKSENMNSNGGLKNIEKEAREKYGRILEHKLTELKLRTATRSPISGLIENAVVEKYENTASMHQFSMDEQMILESSKSLNVLYVYNCTYEPYHIHWLFPLQMAFKQTSTTAEHPYELFMYLHLLIKNIFPSWLEIFAMAERVMNVLKKEDKELFAHLQDSFRRNVTFNPKDFLVELISREREEALKLYAETEELYHYSSLPEELLASPVIFLRKWMGEGFVNSVDLPTLLLIWDQLFMQDWNRKVMENFCLAILLLLKDSFMTAKDYPAVRKVFLSGGYRLFTFDIQRAWIHLQQGGLSADIPGMNHLNARQLHDLSPRHQEMIRNILPIGVKDIILNLTFPLQNADLASNTWDKDFDPNAVKLTASIFYGHIKLRSKTTSVKPSLLQKVTQNKETKKDMASFIIKFKDLFNFESLDPSDYMDNTNGSAQPYILLKAVYSSGERDPFTLGWVKINAFEQEDSSTQEIWLPREFSNVFLLHSERYSFDESTPVSNTSGSNDSSIEFTIYDPAKEIQSLKNTTSRGKSRDEEEHILSIIPFWVPHNVSTILPPPTTVQQSFDLYIDALHYVPDNATITKVSGKILNSGKKTMSPIVALSDLNSYWRNPEFHFCLPVNTKGEKLNIASTVLFEVSTVDLDSKALAVIGYCMLRVFNNEGKLNVGGFQLKLRNSVPSKQLSSLSPSAFNQYTVFPCCSLLIRLLPHTEHPVPAPRYSEGYYFTEEAQPGRSELAIMSTFQKDANVPKLVKDMVAHLMERDQSQVAEAQLKDWYKRRVDAEKSSLQKASLNYINIHNAARYRQEIGICIKIRQAFGLGVEGLYINAFARVLKGDQSLHLPQLTQNWGGEEKFLTRLHDFTSLQASPRWKDSAVVLHPYLDNHSALLVQIFGMDAVYVPNTISGQRGHIVARNGQDVEQNVELEPLIGWTVFPMFNGHYIRSGIHSSPLFEGQPNAEFLQLLSTHPVKTAMEQGLKKKNLKLLPGYGCVTVELWDGHYTDDKHFALPIMNDLLTVGNVKKFLATQTSKKGKAMSLLALKSFDNKKQKLQQNSQEYQQHQQFYEEAMADKFYDLIEMALLNAGYGPL
ncbi:uncharacterized protein LOC108708284 isoform X2 [Xenopus laevis]|uniref:Uncharacterized protein LOC108708284 isoform X2 n=1 Tax=Xenopus laevis TaxID=8355 RepID=A0A8J0UFI0_XENLA|nr:uncharacterized protein LOC108708284 isoform X2 [Xenopus laevis]